jgi:hypothetical protein
MTWRLLLYSFSMLARYQPRQWVERFNLDKPGPAVLQHALAGAALTTVAPSGDRSTRRQALPPAETASAVVEHEGCGSGMNQRLQALDLGKARRVDDDCPALVIAAVAGSVRDL